MKMIPMTPHEQALLPCPFCGDAAPFQIRTTGGWPAIQCSNCGTVGPCVALEIKGAVENWNLRLAAIEAAPSSVSPQAPTASAGTPATATAPSHEGVGQGGTAAGADWKPTVAELEWLVSAPAGIFIVEMQSTGEVRAVLGERGKRIFLPAAPRPDTGEGERHWVYAAAKAHRQLLANAVGTDVAWGFNHLTYMLTEIDGMKSATKACRWLGWVQACLCFTGCATLNELKMINKAASEAARALGRGEGKL